jgi:hypothetical protein
MQQHRLKIQPGSDRTSQVRTFELTGNGPNVFVKRSALKFSDSPIELELAVSGTENPMMGKPQTVPAMLLPAVTKAPSYKKLNIRIRK